MAGGLTCLMWISIAAQANVAVCNTLGSPNNPNALAAVHCTASGNPPNCQLLCNVVAGGTCTLALDPTSDLPVELMGF